MAQMTADKTTGSIHLDFLQETAKGTEKTFPRMARIGAD
jgi:hypothetical protein